MSEEVKAGAVAVEQPQHTPGPWACRGERDRWASHEDWRGDWSHHLDDAGHADGFSTESIAVRAGTEVIALAVHADTTLGENANPVMAANATLIAAAPDLLANLQRLLAHFDNTQMSDPDAFPGIAETLREARLAVAKATTVFPF